MAYPSSFLRLVLSGSLYGVEGWSMGFSLMRNFAPGAQAPTEVPQGVIDAATTFWGSAGLVGDDALLGTIKLNEIGPDGRYVSTDQTVLHDFPTPVAGGGTSVYPPQISLAVTLRTAAARGLAHSGRVYLPNPQPSLGSDGRLGVASVVGIADKVATFINAVNAALPEWVVCVASDVREGEFRKVERVECGRVLDTIRSRRTSMPEERQPATVAITP